jgi:hypothetical protein
MPRLELSDIEAEIIYKHREEQRFYRAGKVEAFNQILDYIAAQPENTTFNELVSKIHEMKANAK